MHTNPEAISQNLNRAESLYLNSLSEYGAAVAGSRWLAGPKREAPELCLTRTLSPAWPQSPLLSSTLLYSEPLVSTRVYLTLLYFAQWSRGSQTAPGAGSGSQHTVTRSIECSLIPKHIRRHNHTNTVTRSHTQTPALQLGLLTAAGPPHSSSEVKICYVM